MTDDTLARRARELLAAEYANGGFPRAGDALLSGRIDTLDECALRAIEAALRLSAGPDWVLVPREPTEAMWQAGKHFCDGHVTRTIQTYSAMLAAAPRHETGEG